MLSTGGGRCRRSTQRYSTLAGLVGDAHHVVVVRIAFQASREPTAWRYSACRLRQRCSYAIMDVTPPFREPRRHRSKSLLLTETLTCLTRPVCQITQLCTAGDYVAAAAIAEW